MTTVWKLWGCNLYNLTLKATAVGSLPHKSAQDAISLIFEKFKEIPFLPQLAAVDKKEAHMKLTRYVRRGDNDREGLLLRIAVGLEISLFTPGGVNSVLKFARIVIFCQFFSHFCIFLFKFSK